MPLKPEQVKKIAEKRHAELTQAERKKIRQDHWMHCPKCGMELHPIPYKDVTVDKCFNCQGLFLDDGELEKIAGREGGFLKGVLSLFR